MATATEVTSRTDINISDGFNMHAIDWTASDETQMISVWFRGGACSINATPDVMREFARRILGHVDSYYPKGA